MTKRKTDYRSVPTTAATAAQVRQMARAAGVPVTTTMDHVIRAGIAALRSDKSPLYQLAHDGGFRESAPDQS